MRETMLVVGDVKKESAFLKQTFEKKYFVADTEDSKEAICYLEDHLSEMAMLFFDIHMPVDDRYDLIRYLKEHNCMKRIPIILITDEKKQELTEWEYDFEATDIISKPFVNGIIEKRINNILELYQYKYCTAEDTRKQKDTVKQKIIKLKEHHDNLLNILHDIITNRNVESVNHIQYVQGYTEILAQQYADLYPDSGMTKDRIEMIVQAARVHDVGKITIPDSITSRPGRLSQYELELLKVHTIKGSEIIKVISEIQEDEECIISYNVCRYHHEKYDGTGYPEGMKQDEIPIEAQIVGLADMYDVLVNATVNKKAFTPKEAFYKLMKGECGELSPQMKECLEAAKESLEAFNIEKGCYANAFD